MRQAVLWILVSAPFFDCIVVSHSTGSSLPTLCFLKWCIMTRCNSSFLLVIYSFLQLSCWPHISLALCEWPDTEKQIFHSDVQHATEVTPVLPLPGQPMWTWWRLYIGKTTKYFKFEMCLVKLHIWSSLMCAPPPKKKWTSGGVCERSKRMNHRRGEL